VGVRKVITTNIVLLLYYADCQHTVFNLLVQIMYIAYLRISVI